VCVGVRLLVVSLPLVEAIYIIQAQWDLGFDIPNSVQVVMQVQKVSNFKGLDKSFDWDEKLILNSKLFRYVLVMDDKDIVAIAINSFQKTWDYLVLKRFHHYFAMVEHSKCKDFLLWQCLVGNMHKNMEGKFIVVFHSHVMV
jgi:hypothetical protein